MEDLQSEVMSLSRIMRWAMPQRGKFAQMAHLFRRRLAKHAPRRPLSAGSRSMGIVISPWLQTAVPFFSIEIGARLVQDGWSVTFIWDAASCAGIPVSLTEVTEIEGCLALARPWAKVAALLDHYAEGASVSPRLRSLAFEARVRELHREPADDDSKVDEYLAQLTHHSFAVKEFLQGRKFDSILLPGGIWGVSGVYWDACAAAGTPLTTYDCGDHSICFQQGGPAAHFPDVSAAVDYFWRACEQSEVIHAEVTRWVADRLRLRRDGRDEFQLQPQSVGEIGSFDVLVPLNYRVDTAAMCRQKLFSNVNDWLRQIVAWSERNPDRRVVIRQHPCERIPEYASHEDYSWVARSSNIVFISASDSVNTYDLMQGVKVVLPYTSRVGIEAALHGRRVVLGAETFYENLGFTTSPATVDAYFEAVEECVDAMEPIDDIVRQRATVAYYVTEQFALVPSSFTPSPVSFQRWVSQSPSVIWSDQNNRMIEHCLNKSSSLTLALAQEFVRGLDSTVLSA